nr:uncharacterized protein LOC103911768 isoform X1 [Danio rerio]|eukprot:XP_021335188.1 uncharacterized protein LOC103911768 isoform X1 [Danio rerio]
MSNSLVSPLKDCFPHFTITSKPVTLEIKNVQPGDSGKYSCKTTTLIPPPSVEESSSLILQVAGLSLKPLNSTNDSCVHLLCSLDSDLANFTWSRGGQMLPLVSTFNADNSELQLCKPDWSGGDTITCHVNYSGTQTQKSIKFSRSENANRGDQDFPAVFVVLLSVFIICISIFWILFYILRLFLISPLQDLSNLMNCIFIYEHRKGGGSWLGPGFVETEMDCFHRFKLTIEPIRLEIENVQPGDSGKYSCKTTRVIPTPSVDESSSLILQVAGYQDFPAVFVALLSVFILCISFIWILLYILRYEKLKNKMKAKVVVKLGALNIVSIRVLYKLAKIKVLSSCTHFTAKELK